MQGNSLERLHLPASRPYDRPIVPKLEQAMEERASYETLQAVRLEPEGRPSDAREQSKVGFHLHVSRPYDRPIILKLEQAMEEAPGFPTL